MLETGRGPETRVIPAKAGIDAAEWIPGRASLARDDGAFAVRSRALRPGDDFPALWN